jgi:hypothetical protein
MAVSQKQKSVRSLRKAAKEQVDQLKILRDIMLVITFLVLSTAPEFAL